MIGGKAWSRTSSQNAIPGKLKKDMREVEAWRGPTGIAWMHMAEFYGVKLDTATTTHPKVMQIYDKISDCEKAILERLPYKPTQSFYHFELPTQQTRLRKQYSGILPRPNRGCMTRRRLNW